MMTTAQLEAWAESLKACEHVMTLDYQVPAEWFATFAAAETPEEWDRILRVSSRCSKSVYAAAQQACNGRDTLSLKTEAYRQRCRKEFDGF